MITNQLLRHPVIPKDYERDKANAIGPDELETRLYMARLLLQPEVRDPDGNRVNAVEGLVGVQDIHPEVVNLFAIQHVSEDGQPEEEIYPIWVSMDGIFRGRAAPIDIAEGYLLDAIGDLERELWEIEESLLVPVVRHLVVPEQQRLLLQPLK